MTTLENFEKYNNLCSSGTACDATMTANSLQDRAVELMKFDVIGHVDSCCLPPVNVTFTSSNLLDRRDSNLVVNVTQEGPLKQISK